MSAVENKKNTEMNTEVKTPKKRVIKTKKVEVPLVVVEEAVPLVVEEVPIKEEDEDDEIEYLRRQQETIARQIKMKENAKKLKTNIGDMRKVLIENRSNKIKLLQNKMIVISNEFNNTLMKLREEVIEQEEELTGLQNLQDSELIESITGNNDLETELGLNIKVAKKSKGAIIDETPNGEIKQKRRPKHYDRRTQFIEMPSGLELFISYKDKTATYIKTCNGVERDGITYKSLMEAGKHFYKETGREKQTFNAWFEFKVMENGKKVSIGDY
jgi:hypothetical protein